MLGLSFWPSTWQLTDWCVDHGVDNLLHPGVLGSLKLRIVDRVSCVVKSLLIGFLLLNVQVETIYFLWGLLAELVLFALPLLLDDGFVIAY
jgi:hypothetical protein